MHSLSTKSETKLIFTSASKNQEWCNASLETVQLGVEFSLIVYCIILKKIFLLLLLVT